MTNLSILLVALQCVIYIYSKISGVDSRPPDYEPTGPFIDDATDAVSWSKLRACVFDFESLDNRKTCYLFQTRDVKEHKEYLQREVVPILKKKFNRLPGVCRRLKRRRITILVFISFIIISDKYDCRVYSAGKSHYACKVFKTDLPQVFFFIFLTQSFDRYFLLYLLHEIYSSLIFSVNCEI